MERLRWRERMTNEEILGKPRKRRGEFVEMFERRKKY